MKEKTTYEELKSVIKNNNTVTITNLQIHNQALQLHKYLKGV